jgi:hypothetical protein
MRKATKLSKYAGHMSKISEGRRSNGMDQDRIIIIILASQ